MVNLFDRTTRCHFVANFQAVQIQSAVPAPSLDQITPFLDAVSHLYKRVCPSVRPSVGPSVRRSVPRYFQTRTRRILCRVSGLVTLIAKSGCKGAFLPVCLDVMLFSRVHASLQVTMSVCWSVGRLVGWSVGLSHFTFFAFLSSLRVDKCRFKYVMSVRQ